MKRHLCAWMVALLVPVTAPGAQDSCDPIRTFADGKKPLREIFVSLQGTDTEGSGSRDNPFKTLARAIQEVRPGDAIRLMGGEHPAGGYIARIAGTADNPIWIGGESGQERPVIRGGSQALHLSRVRFMVIENLEISGAAQNGINCDDGGDVANPEATRHVIFRNLLIRNIGRGGNQDGLKLSGVYNYFVLDSEFHNVSAGGSGIDHVGCHRGLIARNFFTDTGNAIQCKGGSDQIEIRWNRFLRAGGRAINIGPSSTLICAVFRKNLEIIGVLKARGARSSKCVGK